MSKHFERQIENLKRMVIRVGHRVETSVTGAVKSFVNGDKDLAMEVILGDTEIDQQELAVEEACLQVMALYQPVASDLRLVVSVITMCKDLERIGDLSVNLAEQTRFLAEEPGVFDLPYDLREESDRVLAMVRDSLLSLVESDTDLARSVLIADADVDRIHRAMYRQVKEAIRKKPEDAGRLIDLLMASRQLERIADHAVNIAADVVYMVQGEVIRHSHTEPVAHEST